MPRARLLFFAALLVFSPAQLFAKPAPPEPQRPPVTTLSTDLSTWTGDTASWTLSGDALCGASKKKINQVIYSPTTHSRRATISLQFRASPGGDSGLFVYGRQLQVRDYPSAGPKKYAAPAKPAGEWNTLTLILDGARHAQVLLNGTEIDARWRIGRRDTLGLGLQREKGEVCFREITIREP